MESRGAGDFRAGMRPALGILLKVTSITIFVGMSTLIKSTGAVPAGQIVFYRSAFAVLPILVFLAFRRELATAFRTSRPVSHIIRGMVGVCAMGLGFFALTVLPLPEVIMLGYAQPLMVVALSALIVGETVRLFRWSAVVIGLVGVLIIIWPRLTLLTGDAPLAQLETVGVIAALSGAVFAAFAAILVRRLVATEPSATIVLWFSLTAAIFGLMTLPFGWIALSQWQAFALIGAGIAGGVGQILMTESYRHADISTIAPFEYTSMILGIISGYLFFGDLPTVNMLVGGVIVVGAGIFIIWREHRLGLERGKARKITPPQ
ncbi:MAG: DMT family transporter [Rhizobiaceae bacterium]|nr:DMT family transporter [Rhizobiaceae bacterium]